MTKRAVIYRRVSGRKQEDNYSLPTQLESIEAYCKEQGYDIIADFAEVHTGADLEEREQLTLAIDAIRKQKADVLIVHTLDRLSRDQQHLEVIIYHIMRYNGNIEIVQGEKIEDTTMGKLIRHVLGFVAETERNAIRERTMRGRLARAKRGLPNFGKFTPFGYQWSETRDSLELDDVTKLIILRIANELEQGVTMGLVADRLNAEGIPTPTDYTRMSQGLPPHGYKWSQAIISRLIRNPIYQGKHYAFRWRTEKIKVPDATTGEVKTIVRVHDLLEDEKMQGKVIAIECPALISEETMATINERLQYNKDKASRRNAHVERTWLRGYVYCGHCGRKMSVITNAQKPRKDGSARYVAYGYRCGAINSVYGRNSECAGVRISADPLDAYVWQRVRDIILHPDTLSLRSTTEQAGDTNVYHMVDALKHQISDLTRQIDNLTRAVGQVGDDDDTRALLLNQISTLNKRKHEVEEEHQQRLDAEDKQKLQRRDDEVFREWLQIVRDNIDNLSYADRQLVFYAFGVRVTVWEPDHEPRFTLHLDRDETTYWEFDHKGPFSIKETRDKWSAETEALIRDRRFTADNRAPSHTYSASRATPGRVHVSKVNGVQDNVFSDTNVQTFTSQYTYDSRQKNIGGGILPPPPTRVHH